MPCLDISTNVKLEDVDVESFSREATTAVATIIGKPEQFVMIILKGSANITFGGSKEAAALAEIVSMGGITTQVKRELISTIGTIVENKLSIPRARFVLKVYDTTLAKRLSKM
ncbi:macrophage migration inhibitory factor homolog [Ipomoea triloba]|uniref:macrophage migration inhibitory factor homolog n=1 Tax=Ipomoea triloba TaxID=35885 RepID=UPI00125E681C|nr:macrophage migration inhibitory factor homolog [Ipomoea triloba]GMC81816.1 macrophage migration inhibitory factor homolog [Ipomoea batatas]